MIKNLNQNQEEQADLRIVEHLDMQKLPESIQQMVAASASGKGIANQAFRKVA